MTIVTVITAISPQFTFASTKNWLQTSLQIQLSLSLTVLQLTFTDEGVINASTSPPFLHEAWTASFTLVTTGVVHAGADQLVPKHLGWAVTGVCVAVTHTAPSNGDILDAVVVLEGTEKYWFYHTQLKKTTESKYFVKTEKYHIYILPHLGSTQDIFKFHSFYPFLPLVNKLDSIVCTDYYR